MKPLRPINPEEDQLRRAAARRGLCFHIEVHQGGWGTITTHAGCNSETRDATDPEVQMWLILVGRIEGTLDADVREFEYRFHSTGPVYLCAEDVEAVLSHEHFSPNGNDGRIGTFRGTPIFVSEAIPKGYYVNLHRRIPELATSNELDDALRWELEADLQPLMM